MIYRLATTGALLSRTSLWQYTLLKSRRRVLEETQLSRGFVLIPPPLSLILEEEKVSGRRQKSRKEGWRSLE